MALTFPRDLPFDGQFSADCPFFLQYMQSQSLAGSGQPDVADLGPAYWVAQYGTEVLTREAFEVWSAWLATMRGGLKTFKGRPPRRKWPRMYPRGFAGLTVSGSPFDGTGNLSAIGSGRDTVTVNQLPNGMLLKIGDYFSIPVGGKQHIHKIVEDATVSGAGGVTLTVEPTIRPNAVTSVEVRLEAAYCDMVIRSKTETPRSNGRGGSISFEAIQVI